MGAPVAKQWAIVIGSVAAATTITTGLMMIELAIQFVYWVTGTLWNWCRRLYATDFAMMAMAMKVASRITRSVYFEWARDADGPRQWLLTASFVIGWKTVREITSYGSRWVSNVNSHPDINEPIPSWTEGMYDTARIIIEAIPEIIIE